MILEFPKKNTQLEAVPDYTGRLLALNREKARSFQCGGFFVGLKRLTTMVEEDAQMDRIHAAIQAGILIDVTDNKELNLGGTVINPVQDMGDTGKRAYITETGSVLMTEDPEQIALIEKQLEAKSLIELPPGFEDPDKYLIKVN